MKTIKLVQEIPLELVKAQEQEAASIKEIARILQLEGSLPKLVSATGEEITLPNSVYRVLRQVVQTMALGKAVTVIPQDQELTTQQAADVLNVSRPYLIKLLEQGEIPYTTVGTHRRVHFDDVMKYKQERDIKRRKFLDELIAESQELGFYE